MRDSLSLLDQAIAHAAGTVRADAVRQMLGLADRTRVIDLFGHLACGDIAAAFGEFRDQYDTGADPVVVLSDLAEFVNFVTRVKIVPSIADNVAFGETERLRARDYATKLSMRVLSRMWQMLLKGISRGARRHAAGRGGRNGAGADRLCGRSADAGRSREDARPEWRRFAVGRQCCAQWRLGVVGRSAIIGAAIVDAAHAGAARFGGSLVLRSSANGDACAGAGGFGAGAEDRDVSRNWWRSPRRSAI